MRILFDQAVYDMRNKGNVALLQVAVTRMGKFWPGAGLEVITLAPHLLKLYCPDARPASPEGNYNWHKNRTVVDNMVWHMPRSMLRLLFELREELWYRWPKPGAGLRNLRLKSLFRVDKKAPTFETKQSDAAIELVEHASSREQTIRVTDLNTVQGIDLFVATGAQYMSDACKKDALRVLDRLEAACELGIPTALVGQGIGPIEDGELRARASAVLPQVNFVLIREQLESPQLLQSFGVDPNRIIFTGDDAIELAYNARTLSQGSGIGVSMRVAHYTEVRGNHVEVVRPVLQQAAAKYNAPLFAIPISHSAHELDDQVLRQLLTGPAKAVHTRWRFDTPLDLIRRVGKCRLVVTGAFHTAVFALSQGIPAVGLARSSMYRDKFLGLIDQFGNGCQVVFLDDPDVEEKLTTAIARAWSTAEEVKPQLLAAAQRQIKLGHAAYQRIYELVEENRSEKQPFIERNFV